VGTGRGATGPSKKDRREAAREHARLLREEERKRAKRRKFWVQGGVGVGILAVLAVVALVIVNAVQPEGPGPKNMLSNGIVLTSTTEAAKTAALGSGQPPVATKQTSGDSVAHITVYVDYQCPYCKQFETTNAEQIGQWLDSGFATLEVHPIAMLDSSSSGTKYSTRSANAAACVANSKPSAFFAVNSALFENQPAEGGTGLTDKKILSIMKDAGASSSALTRCVNDLTFGDWVASATNRALSKPLPNSNLKKITGTPTVIVNGQQYNGALDNASTFLSFVSGIMSSGSSDSGSTATPTPTPTQ
jgi:protein-disulfide isomerase